MDTDDEIPIFIPIDTCLPRLLPVLGHRNIVPVVEDVVNDLGYQLRS
jgi:hypothetical protein